MKQILKDYLEIQQQFSAAMSKEQRKVRHRLLVEWQKREYFQYPAPQELISFMKEHKKIAYFVPFSIKVVLPCLRAERKAGSTDLLAYLCSYPDDDAFAQNCLSCFCAEENIDFLQLSDFLYKTAPENTDFLRFRFRCLTHSLSYSVHELPIMLLDTEEEPPIEKEIEDWRALAQRQGLDVNKQAEILHLLCDSWKKYTDMKKTADSFQTFEAYLEREHVPWKSVFSASFWLFEK